MGRGQCENQWVKDLLNILEIANDQILDAENLKSSSEHLLPKQTTTLMQLTSFKSEFSKFLNSRLDEE